MNQPSALTSTQPATELLIEQDSAIGRFKRLSEQTVLAQNVQLDLERHLFVESLHSVEAQEGIAAFLAKRKPDFSDKA